MVASTEPTPSLRVVVIGGEGFYGSRVVQELRDRGHVVSVAGRPPTNERKTVAVDLLDPSTFDSLAEYDVIVAIANSVSAPSDALLSWVDRNGATFVEASAFAPFYRGAMARAQTPTDATIVLGAGVFPGESTALACQANEEAHKAQDVERIDVAVRLSPFSGSGWGNALLMARMLALPSYEYVNGARVERPTVGRTRTFAFTGGEAVAAQVDLPDVELVHHATRAPNVTTWMALRPAWMLTNFRVLAWIVGHSGPLRRLLLAMLHIQLALLRGLLLRDRTTRVELTAEATGTEGPRVARVEYEDGFAATAVGVARAVEATAGLSPGWHVAGKLIADRVR